MSSIQTTETDRCAPLLEHAGWIRRLARQLTADAARAEDLAQETWLRMLSCPPRAGGPVRGWIATVMRNVVRKHARDEKRRVERERHAARIDGEDPDLVDRVAIHRGVVDAVLRLDEPYRTTVMLRYFEELSPKAIASRQGIPVSTVKTRLARGLELLRKRLDRQHGGDGRGWLIALIPLTQRPGGGGLPWFAATKLMLGVIAMNSKFSITLISLAIAVAGVSWYAMSNPSPAGAEPIASSDSTRTPTASERQIAPTRASTTGSTIDRSRVTTSPDAADMATTEPDATQEEVHGRVVDLTGTPVAGVRVDFRATTKTEPRTPVEPISTTSDEHGRFTLTKRAKRGPIVVDDERYVTVMSADPIPARSGAEPVVVVAPRISIGGRIGDELGTPIAGALVRFRLPRDLRARIDAMLDHSIDCDWETRSAADGSVRLDALPAVSGAELIVRAEGFGVHEEPAPRFSRDDWTVVLNRPGTSRAQLRGVVVDAGGTPISGASVSVGLDSVVSDDDGSFVFELDAEHSFNKAASRFFEVDSATILAIKPGHQPGTVHTDERNSDGKPVWPAHVTVRLGPEPLTIAGVVVDEHENPLDGMRVWVADPTLFGGIGDPATQRFPTFVHVENVLDGREPGWHFVTTDANGAFRIDGLVDRRYTLHAMDSDTLLRSVATEITAGSGNVRLVLSSEGLFESLRGRTVGLDGTPIPNVTVTPMCDSMKTRVQGRTIATRHSVAGGTTSGKDGWFELERVPRNLAYLRFDGTEIVPLEWGRREEGGLAQLVGSNHKSLVITLGRRCRFQVRLNDPSEADSISMLDTAGERLVISEFLGNGRRDGRSQAISNGRSSQLGVSDAAITLVLFKHGKEVRRAPVRLAPGERSVLDL